MLLEGSRFCLEPCLERPLLDAIERARLKRKASSAAHRIPLGLLLLSRQQISPEQLRAALDAQRDAGRGRLGEWLVCMGFTTEEKITAALARQWSCPILRTSSALLQRNHIPQLPSTLLETFGMIPLDYVPSTATLHIAFGGNLHHNVLYAIEKMTGSHTAPCIAGSNFVRASLQKLLAERSQREIAFDTPFDAIECSRIIRSYCARLSTSEIRLVGCGAYIWARLFQQPRPAMDIVFRAHVSTEPGSQANLDSSPLPVRR